MVFPRPVEEVATPGRPSKSGLLPQEGFDRLLRLLDPDRDQAAARFETLRRKLVRFFEWRRFRPAEELADETLDRVARRLAEGMEIELASPEPFVYGVARNVAREAAASAARSLRPVTLGADAEAVRDPSSVEEGSEELDRSLRCLDHCLEALPLETRQLLLLYHGADATGRREIAETLRVARSALCVRMHRLRKRVEGCVRQCLESNGGSVKGSSPLRHSQVTKE